MNNHHHPYDPHRGDYTCAFCGKTGDLVNAMISGPNGIYICDECISVCADAMMRDLGFSMSQELDLIEEEQRTMRYTQVFHWSSTTTEEHETRQPSAIWR